MQRGRAIAVGGGVMALVACSSGPRGPLGEADVRMETRGACEWALKRTLNNPSSASFAPPDEWTIARAGDSVTARAWVEAQVPAGGTVRRPFVCAAVVSGDTMVLPLGAGVVE